MTATLDDPWALVSATQSGDMDAYGQLYRLYQPKVFGYVLASVGDRALAEDLTQETFTRALRRIASVTRQGVGVGAWFTTIAKHLVCDHWKASYTRRTTPVGEVLDGPGPVVDLVEDVAVGAVALPRLRCALSDAMRHLTPDQQEVLAHRFWGELPLADVAVVMGRHEGAVKALQHRAVAKMRELVAGQGLVDHLHGASVGVPEPRCDSA